MTGTLSHPSSDERSPHSAGSGQDDVLIAGLRGGDESTYVMLMRLHNRAMLLTAELYVASRATAEDVVQETWLAILEGIDGFEQRCTLKTWMFHILANQARSAARRERRCVADSVAALCEIDGRGRALSRDRYLDCRRPRWPLLWKQPPMPWESVADDRVIASEDVAIVHVAINGLPPIPRLVISLRDVDCWTATEVCDLLGISENHQRVLLHRARSAVRQRLQSFHENGGGALSAAC